jgi:hypothetical protein
LPEIWTFEGESSSTGHRRKFGARRRKSGQFWAKISSRQKARKQRQKRVAQDKDKSRKNIRYLRVLPFFFWGKKKIENE